MRAASDALRDTLRTSVVATMDAAHWPALHRFTALLTMDDVRLRFGTAYGLGDQESVVSAFRGRVADGEMIWARQSDDTLVGIASCAWLGPVDMEIGLIVRSDLKRMGIGTRLLDAVKQRACQQHACTLHGFVMWENWPMRQLARKSGFATQRRDGTILEIACSLLH